MQSGPQTTLICIAMLIAGLQAELPKHRRTHILVSSSAKLAGQCRASLFIFPAFTIEIAAQNLHFRKETHILCGLRSLQALLSAGPPRGLEVHTPHTLTE